uniref:WKF domain-containing protein n=1 Tax=Peronospora matthiolae TaxID=2874970 RepID=A0AAV1VME0_9STRA
MPVPKPSKKQRGKLKSLKTKKEPAKTHVKFDDNGDKVVPKKRARVITTKEAGETNEGGGKSDRSPDAIQQANYYLEQWQKRDEPKSDDELPWKFKKIKQQWILHWMYEADVVPKSMFAVVLQYLDGIQGAARERVADKAQSIIDIGVPSKEEENAAAGEQEKMLSIKLARRRYKRALQVAELLA